jgi:hypothetical protein
MAASQAAAKAFQTGAEAEVDLLRIALEAGGQRVVVRKALGAAEVAAPALVEHVIRDLVGHNQAVRTIFAEAERHFVTAITSPNSAKWEQARLAMDTLHGAWMHERAALASALGPEARDTLARLEAHFDSRFGFVSWTSETHYEDPARFADEIRKRLGKTQAVPGLADELADVRNAMPFLEHAGDAAEVPAARGRELLNEVRAALLKSGDKVQREALATLEQFCVEGHVVYDEVVQLVTAQRATYLEKGKSLGAEFVQDTANKVQARIAEMLALRSPEFQRQVWKPLQRSAEVLRDRLNALSAGAGLWRVETITEPVLATLASGHGGQLSDAGVWLIRDSDGLAMPVFILEVKSGELRTSIVQQVLDRERLNGGLIQLPATGRTYRLTPPPEQEVQYALATTREVSDARFLGLTKGDTGPRGRLLPRDTVLVFQLPMTHEDLKLVSRASVESALKLPPPPAKP